MDEEGIGLVLARATELRLNINNCIHRATPGENGPKSQEQGDAEEVNETEEEGEETANLLNICDALESLESQLSTLQAMQQNQQYEREAALADIEYSRKALLDKLKEYKGKDLEVIQEATVFASETVEQSSDLLLPPYPIYPPLSKKNSHKSARNGAFPSDLTNGTKKNLSESGHNQPRRNPTGGLVHIVGTVAKTMVTLVGVVSVLRLAGFNPSQRKVNAPFRILNMFLPPLSGDRESSFECPPGKVLVVEDGQARCLVKERVEVPFESAVSTADVNYGCG